MVCLLQKFLYTKKSSIQHGKWTAYVASKGQWIWGTFRQVGMFELGVVLFPLREKSEMAAKELILHKTLGAENK